MKKLGRSMSGGWLFDHRHCLIVGLRLSGGPLWTVSGLAAAHQILKVLLIGLDWEERGSLFVARCPEGWEEIL